MRVDTTADSERMSVDELSTTRKFSFDRDTLADLQLAALKKGFDRLVNGVSVLRRFAEGQNLTEIRSIEDGALLLFPHTIYKSYPLSVLENGRYDTLTRWIGTLTTVDVTNVATEGCDSLDGWLDALDAATDLRVRHSSGTTGKLSFIPTSLPETYTGAMGFKRYFEGFGDEPDANVDGIGELPLISFCYRKGAQSMPRTLESIARFLYGGDDSKFVTINPGRMSADMMSLGGRLQGAESKGERGRMQLSQALQARRDEFAREQADIPKRLKEFFEIVSTRFKAQRVILNGLVPGIVETALEGLKNGYERLFARDSLFFAAGGAKGRALPEDYPALVEQFTGVVFPRTGYGMSEAASGIVRMCPRGRYHILPNLIAYLVDPVTGALLPRTGTQTGRYGFIDIATQTRWGGFLTGDEVTLNWGDLAPCECGRKGAFIEGAIRRYSEAEGGDDKITCTGAPDVHEKALEFMNRMMGE